MTTPIIWKGKQEFRVAGTNLHEDTLRIRSNYKKREDTYRLRLPTLCITYADMKFSNAIGGEQLRWPDSTAYGPKYFDPPVEIMGLAEVDRLTWIRGAHRVVIGPQETVIEWRAGRDLVIPRLRISAKKPVKALFEADNAIVEVEPPLRIDIAQYADGRSIGGVSVVKRHPDWREPPREKPTYRLWVRVVDFATGQLLREAKLAFFQWKGADGSGIFAPVESAWTDNTGSVVRDHRPAEVLEAVTLAMDGWRATARVWRAQANEPVNLLMSAARLRPGKYPAAVPGAGRKLFEAAYNLDPGDTLEWLAEAFRYKEVAELARMNKASAPGPGALIPLPGWCFVQAQPGETLASIAEAFKVDPAWPRTTGRHHRPSPSTLLEHEIVAVPFPQFVEGRKPY